MASKDLELIAQALELMETAYDLMLDHETLCGQPHLDLLDKIEDCVDRMLYLQVEGNVRKLPKYQGIDASVKVRVETE